MGWPTALVCVTLIIAVTSVAITFFEELGKRRDK